MYSDTYKAIKSAFYYRLSSQSIAKRWQRISNKSTVSTKRNISMSVYF